MLAPGVDELVKMANIALANAAVVECTAGDTNHDTRISVDELVTAVNNALSGCSDSLHLAAVSP